MADYITQEDLARELAKELHLDLVVVRPVIKRIFLKILKHLMYGRDVRINKFGLFSTVFRSGRTIETSISEKGNKASAKFVPKFRFTQYVKDLVKSSHAELAEEHDKENANDDSAR